MSRSQMTSRDIELVIFALAAAIVVSLTLGVVLVLGWFGIFTLIGAMAMLAVVRSAWRRLLR